MPSPLTRRGLLVGTASLLVAGCIRPAPAPPPIPVAGPQLPPPAPDEGLWYTVERGDTLHSISRRAGIPRADIVTANRLEGSLIKPGQRLWLPQAVAIIGRPAAPAAAATELADHGEPYQLIPRSSWTDARIGDRTRPMGRVERITVHHTDETPGLANLPDTEVLRRIDRYHREGRHWPSIGYHYLIGKDGNVYEGRPVQFQGTHVAKANSNNLGIAVMGDFSHHLPSPRQLRALRAFLDDSRYRFHLSAGRVYGHRELGSSDCPGGALFAWLREYRGA
jgi:hypothetical protein